MSPRTISILWKLTGLVAIGMLIVTISLAGKSSAHTDVEVVGYIKGASSSVYLRAQPSGASNIVTILNNGEPVVIKNTRNENGQNWHNVETEDFSGWVPAENISLTPP